MRIGTLTGIGKTWLAREILDYAKENAELNLSLKMGSEEDLIKKFESNQIFKGFTGTAGGFYGPQGRVLRLNIQDPKLNSKMDAFNYNGTKMTNLEMETGAIYGLGKLLGHQCLSLNAIIANRADGTFSEDPYKTVDQLIEYTLMKLTE